MGNLLDLYCAVHNLVLYTTVSAETQKEIPQRALGAGEDYGAVHLECAH